MEREREKERERERETVCKREKLCKSEKECVKAKAKEREREREMMLMKRIVKSVCIVLQTIEHKKRTRKVPKSQKHFFFKFPTTKWSNCETC